MAAARAAFAKMGGVMTANHAGPGAAAKPQSVSEIFSSIQKGHSEEEKKTIAASAASANGATQQQRVAMAAKDTDVMMDAGGGKGVKVKTEMAVITDVTPNDNLMVKTPQKGDGPVSYQLDMTWKSQPENAPFVVRFIQKGFPEEVQKVQADDGDVSLTHVFKRSGDYTWRIEDYGGAVLAVRSIHINTKFESILMDEPVLIGRERGSTMWGGQDKWGMLFKWRPVAGVTSYKVRIARNVDSKKSNGVVAQHATSDTEFILPYKKEWQAERMFLWVEAQRDSGQQIASSHVPFMFTFLPPKPRVPKNKKTINRETLVEGELGLIWESDSEADKFTVEIARDPHFQNMTTAGTSARTPSASIRRTPASTTGACAGTRTTCPARTARPGNSPSTE